jgi:hypothetical protein
MPGIQRFGAGHLYHSLWGEISTGPLEEESLVKYLLEVLLAHLPCIKDSCLLVAPPSSALPVHLPCHHSPLPP